MKRVKKTIRKSANRQVISENTPFAIKESFGMLRTNIMYTRSTDTNSRVFGIVSAEESVGKSTITANIAYSFAQTGKKVLIIDGDMRCPTQYQFYKIDEEANGLSEILAGIVSNYKEALHDIGVENLHLIPSGHLPPNPSELILSPRFEQLLKDAKEEYDYIFIDFPPVGIVTDALSVASLVPEYIFAIRSNVSDIVKVNATIKALESANANIIGVVLSDVSYKSSERYKKSNYGYYGSYYESAGNNNKAN